MARVDCLSFLDEELGPDENPSPSLGVALGLLGVAGEADGVVSPVGRTVSVALGGSWPEQHGEHGANGMSGFEQLPSTPSPIIHSGPVVPPVGRL